MGWFDAFRVEQILAGCPIHVLNVVQCDCTGIDSDESNLPQNAVTVSPDKRFEGKDDNIQSGLDPDFVVERMLASAYAGRDELWIAQPKELLLLYLNQYIPETAKNMLTKVFAKKYAVTNKAKPAEEDNEGKKEL